MTQSVSIETNNYGNSKVRKAIASMDFVTAGYEVRINRNRAAQRTCFFSLVVAIFAGFLTLAYSTTSEARSAVRKIVSNGQLMALEIVHHKAETLESDNNVAEILVGNPAIADVVALTNRKLYVLGKKIGMTSVTLLGQGKSVIAVLNVNVTHDLPYLRDRLRSVLPNTDIRVQAVNGGIFLAGVVPSSHAVDRAMKIAQQIAPKAVTNGLTVRGSQQVQLEVRFIEANREASRDISVGSDVVGTGILAATGISAIGGGIPLFGLASNNTPFGVAIARILDNGTTADVIIQALERKGLARRLAEPNLVAQSGQSASFLAGGEFPFPVQSDEDTISVEFKKFGVGLSFTPTVLGGGLINLVIEPEVSELDPSSSLRVGGVEIPSLTVRRAKTTIELRDGQSFAMAGLLQANNFKNRRQLPWIGQVPILGALFASSSFQKRETELVIIVTPRLVRPKRPGPKQVIRTPFDTRVSSNDAEFFLRGQTEVKVGRPEPYTGHILQLANEEPVGTGSKAGARRGSKYR
ncbi:MAG: type II and III secretion system protein family protein [Pseudomonadota bacterium]